VELCGLLQGKPSLAGKPSSWLAVVSQAVRVATESFPFGQILVSKKIERV